MTGERILVSVDSASPSFYRLITNPEAPPFDRQEVEDSAIARVRKYARFVSQGDGQPFCPYVQQTEGENGYVIRPYRDLPERLDLRGVLGELEDEFHRRSPGPTRLGQALDTTIIMAAFDHPDADGPTFCERLADTYEANRLRILENGMLIGYMSPSHPPDERGRTLFRSDIAILSVDRLHPSHTRFMRNDDERRIHNRFFRRYEGGGGWYMD